MGERLGGGEGGVGRLLGAAVNVAAWITNKCSAMDAKTSGELLDAADGEQHVQELFLVDRERKSLREKPKVGPVGESDALARVKNFLPFMQCGNDVLQRKIEEGEDVS